MSNNRITEAHGSLGKCLICQTPGTEAKPTKRGLCANHYQQYYNQRQKIPKDRRKDFDARLIKEEKLLASRQGESDEENPFAEIASEFLPEVIKDAQKAVAKLDAKSQPKTAPKEIVPAKKPRARRPS